MEAFGARLAELGCALRITDTADRPADWKLADWEGTRDEFIAWAKAHTAGLRAERAHPGPDEGRLPL
jgi:hypothetical protein